MFSIVQQTTCMNVNRKGLKEVAARLLPRQEVYLRV
jgi:hypothetical protein